MARTRPASSCSSRSRSRLPGREQGAIGTPRSKQIKQHNKQYRKRVNKQQLNNPHTEEPARQGGGRRTIPVTCPHRRDPACRDKLVEASSPSAGPDEKPKRSAPSTPAPWSQAVLATKRLRNHLACVRDTPLRHILRRTPHRRAPVALALAPALAPAPAPAPALALALAQRLRLAPALAPAPSTSTGTITSTGAGTSASPGTSASTKTETTTSTCTGAGADASTYRRAIYVSSKTTKKPALTSLQSNICIESTV